MIGLVLVSHSRALAEAAVELAGQMVAGDDGPRTRIAAGLDDGSLGTDAAAVADAVADADSGDGVLVLLDLGSAVLSAEMALELVDPDVAARTRLTAAPVVEGLVAATVAASVGGDLAAVAREAEQGLLAKREHLSPDGAPDAEPADGSSDDGPASADARTEVEVTAPHGLHARPAALLVRTLAGHDARVRVRNLTSGRGPVDGSSLSAVATLDARRGHRLELTASGPDAARVLEAVDDLAQHQFGDRPPPPTTPPTARGSGLDVAIGPAVVVDTSVDVSDYRAGDPDAEQQRLDGALRAATDQIGALAETADQSATAAILDAHRALLADPALLEPTRAAITSGSSAPEAWTATADEVHRRFAELPDAYQRARADDVREVRDRVLAALVGRPGTEAPRPDAGGILVVGTLDAARAAGLDPSSVGGVVTRRGGTTGHGVLIAQARGIPLLADVGDVAIHDGDLLAFDARTHRLLVRPDDDQRAELEQLIEARRHEREQAEAAAGDPVVLGDGSAVHVVANVGAATDANGLRESGADGIGLVRTEVLFADLPELPSVEQQTAAFLDLAGAVDGPVTIRTWDVGADKPLPFLAIAPEDNPFLGARGLRVFRTGPEPLVQQLQAVCRAAREAPVRVMFPMVSRPDEVDWALARLAEAGDREGGVPPGLAVGAMVEVPAAALRVAEVARRLSFVSIGTNDLTQYVMAAGRGNEAVQDLLDPADPAVLRLVALVCDEVGPGVDVAVCGDAASRPEVAARLVALGVRELSVSPPAIPLVKAALRGQ
ncbi:dihydroxyacetone kinase phosphoryl donor subunit DhaM [Luteipulveratus flavus]|uniref:Phosphocarrier protein HPr n=1 Tax=Luteipulveratus flavus TaxID=3031728 RepID=A0ABT6C8X5_9MICO|nr:dihydroxyacetone kinase phosphoryl donor subunit DhaM [Luteipulveratus sp. YIM 133296]MDF8265340.1 dihydroxyacetone kinase phosphoryl donor subunit DhaM [Luteipulveratus sp. YIM 133296]